MAKPADTTNPPVRRKCLIGECDRLLTAGSARGLCPTHYQRLRKTGRTDLAPLRGRIRKPRRRLFEVSSAAHGEKVCSAPTCQRRAEKSDLCDMHYQRLRRRGSLDVKGTAKGEVWKWLVENSTRSDDGCLIWPFARYPSGYGQANFDGGPKNAHRVMCIIAHGEPPFPKADAAHSCGRGADGCVHPLHLSWKTHKDNMADTISHGTSTRGERAKRCKVSNSDALAIYTDARPNVVIAREYGVKRRLVYEIKNGINRDWLTGHSRRMNTPD